MKFPGASLQNQDCETAQKTGGLPRLFRVRATNRPRKKPGPERGSMRTEYLLAQEVDHVLAALMPQNRLIMELALHTGLRISDILGMTREQLKPQGWITEAKTGKRRQYGIPADLLRKILAQAGKEWAFPGRNEKNPKTRQAVWADVKRAAKAFRLPQNVAPHSIFLCRYSVCC